MKVKRNRVAILLLTVLALTSLVLAACTSAGEEASPEEASVSTSAPEPTSAPPTDAPAPPTEVPAPPVEQKLTFGLQQIATRVDATVGSQHAWRAEFLIYDPLVRMGADGSPVAALATSWQALDDTTWEFKLREGVKFQNGEDFDAEAVKYSIDYVLNPDNNISYSRNISKITDVQVIDKNTVRIITDGPQAVLVPNLIGVMMLPPEYHADVGAEAFNKAPIGTGPYKLVEFAPDERIVLERNEDYWSDAYQLDTIEYIEMQEASTRMAALEAGEVDVVDALPIDQVARLEAAGLVAVPVTTATTVDILLETPVQREEFPFLSDQQVRQALNYAVNRQEIVDELMGGYGRPALGQFVGPDGFGYDPDFSMYEYDPAKARQMLADAGYPDGFTFTVPYPVARYPYGDDVVAVVASYLADVGVTMELEPLENAAWVEKYLAVELPTTLFAPNYDPTMDVDRILWMCSSEFPRKWVQGNPEFDALLEEERGILDAEERLPVLQAAARACAEMAPVIFTVFPPQIYAYNPDVQNIGFRSDLMFDLAGVSIGN